LRKGDVLQINGEVTSFRKKTIAPQALEQLAPRKVLRVTPGPQSEWFPETSLPALCENTYRVAEESNRMGLRLEGRPIARESTSEMITEGVSLGAVQITASGLPIILFVEQQTTGGYPKIANVISADLHSLGQLRPRDEIRFEQVGWEAARSLLLQQQHLLASDGLIVG
jgi:allophanate hydrolase subunit 2